MTPSRASPLPQVAAVLLWERGLPAKGLESYTAIGAWNKSSPPRNNKGRLSAPPSQTGWFVIALCLSGSAITWLYRPFPPQEHGRIRFCVAWKDAIAEQSWFLRASKANLFN